MKVADRIAALRGEMVREGIDIWIVPSADYHQSEYVGSFFKARQYMTGFTGSAGTAVFKGKAEIKCLQAAVQKAALRCGRYSRFL